MKTNIFIPKKINVGFQERSTTYTGKLAYIIYFDEKGVLRKEKSWESWRDKNIPSIIHDNEPTEGFVLNKQAGGYSSGWNHRQTYVRVYDPRGFEFEIDVTNLLYILENTSCIKGKGLEGEFVYGWDGKNLMLIPVSSPDYIEISKVNEILHNKTHITGKDLIIGATYLTKDNEKLIYMGKYDEYESWARVGKEIKKKKGKSFYFWDPDTKYSSLVIKRSLGNNIISCIDEECVENYAELMEKVESRTSYSPIDDSKDVIEYLTVEEFEAKFEDVRYGRWSYFHFKTIIKEGTQEINQEVDENDNVTGYYYNEYSTKITFKDSAEVIEKLKPYRTKKYLANGKYNRTEE